MTKEEIERLLAAKAERRAKEAEQKEAARIKREAEAKAVNDTPDATSARPRRSTPRFTGLCRLC
jgi:sRNA-binding protein